MYLDRLSITGYKCFDAEFSIDLSPGVNVLVGENAVGKSAIIDAIRLVLREDEFGHRGIRDTDFHCAFTKGAHSVGSLRIKAHLDKLTEEQRVAFLPWSDAAGKATLTMHVDNKLTAQDRYRPVVWGGASRASAFEWELFDTIKCIYLPPLRDAEAKLSDGRGSRLARFIRNLNTKELGTAKKANTKHPLEEHMRKFNEDLASDKGQTIHQANELIRSRLKDALGPVFGQDTSIQFSEVSFSRIVESLRLLFFPKAMSKVDTDVFRGLEENSLGYNNLLYLATVLAELTLPHTQTEYLKVLLIEEPEAHLHPQIQVRLLRYLQSTAKEAGVQVIVSTHSPVLAASASLDSLIHIVGPGTEPASATGLKSCGFSITSKPFVTRWLDATKSTLFFSRGVLLVEGIAESLVIPELAKLVLATHNDCAKKNKKEALPETLEDAGVSVINMNGIYFRHFMQAFCDLKEAETTACIPVRCAGITDQDPVKTIKYAADPKKGIPYRPTPKDIETRKDELTSFKWPPAVLPKGCDAATLKKPEAFTGTNHDLPLCKTINASKWARLFSNSLRTLEYDLAMEKNNLPAMCKILAELCDDTPQVKDKLVKYSVHDWSEETETHKAMASHYLLEHIDKGEFAQSLAEALSSKSIELSVPEYINKAVMWACGGDLDG